MRQRWYPAKDAGPPEVAPVALLPVTFPQTSAAVAVWKALPRARPSFEVFVPVAIVPDSAADPTQVIARVDSGTRAVVDAFSVDGFVRGWIAAQTRSQNAIPADEGSLCLGIGQTEQVASSGIASQASWDIRRSQVEQSNTSLRIGEDAILKVIRRLEPGVHPELEVGRHLTRAGFQSIAPLFGWVELGGSESGGARTLSILQGFVPNRGDGWSWVLARLSGAVADGNRGALEEINGWLEALARATADMHRAFAAETTDSAFQPEPVTAQDYEAWAAAAHSMKARTLEAIGAGIAGAQDGARQLAGEISQREQRLAELLGAPARVRADFAKTRHHGDFHLGQVLVVPGGAVILDFEGEPLRPLAERRAKHSVLRDVAGMVRSLSYAAGAAGRALPRDLPPARRRLAHGLLGDWEAEARHRFLHAYFVAADGMRSVPKERSQAELLLRFFLLEKALYEVAYEMANRPDWISIPLSGVLELLANGPADQSL